MLTNEQTGTGRLRSLRKMAQAANGISGPPPRPLSLHSEPTCFPTSVGVSTIQYITVLK